jgi:Transglutaminase-like superfamily
VLEAAAALPATWIAMRVAGFSICNAALTRPLSAPSPTGANVVDTISAAQRVARLEAATARALFLRSTCLEQSLVLCWMLRRRGMSPVLRVGARKDADRLEAHAWVEIDGIALGDDAGQHAHFVPFERDGVPVEARLR